MEFMIVHKDQVCNVCGHTAESHWWHGAEGDCVECDCKFLDHNPPVCYN